MTPGFGQRGRADWSAVFIFALVYLAALGVIIAPGSLRPSAPGVTDTPGPFPASTGIP